MGSRDNINTTIKTITVAPAMRPVKTEDEGLDGTNTGLKELIRTHRLPFFIVFLTVEVTILGVVIYLTSEFRHS